MILFCLVKINQHENFKGVGLLSFHPQMECQIKGIKLIDKLHFRIFDGAIIDIWTVECSPDMQGHYISQSPRLFMTLESSAEICFVENSSQDKHPPLREMDLCYIPAHIAVSSQLSKPGYIKHLDVHFDIELLQDQFENVLDIELINTPNLSFHNEKIAQIGKLLAQDCCSPTPLHNLYGEGLLHALVAELFQIPPTDTKKNAPLSQRQLKQVTDFIKDNYTRIIRLEELSTICGLSKSYFCTAFKTSTGTSPLSFQMQYRIKKAKSLLENKQSPISDIATSIGFSDQAHFTRVFKKINGTTPKEWSKVFS